MLPLKYLQHNVYECAHTFLARLNLSAAYHRQETCRDVVDLFAALLINARKNRLNVVDEPAAYEPSPPTKKFLLPHKQIFVHIVRIPYAM